MSREREGFNEYEIGKKIKSDNFNSVATIDHAISSSSSSGLMGKRHPVAAQPGTTLNTVTPCAACKLLRRRCAGECPFSPYFSPHEPRKFAAVHKVFGASNVSKMLMEVPERQRADAANSLVYEANLRLRDPVYGSMGAISALQHQIQSLQSELNAVRSEILRYKYREAAANNPNNNSIINMPATGHINGVASVVSVASAPPPPLNPSPLPQTLSQPPQPPPRPPTPPPLPSVVVATSLSSSSTTSSMHNPPCGTAGYGSINSSDNNLPYFD